ncbi:MAG: hypothetical protein ACXADH_16505 [Candidatus Kariarchaeaceae archaeon]|jgi:GTP:adenosylcobinamide-phosphate guanylyltransferase
MSLDKLPFILLAGSPLERDTLMEYADVDYKALIDVSGKPMISYVLEAICDSETASRIFIAGLPKEKLPVSNKIDLDLIEFVDIDGDAVEKIVKAASHLVKRGQEDPSVFPSGTTHGIYINADIPAVTSKDIQSFLTRCGDRSASFYYSIISQESMDNQFPNNGRTFTKIDGDNYCGADITLAELSKAEPSYPLIKKIMENRKSFVKALFWASPITFFKFIFKRVGLKDTERLMTKIFKMESRLIISDDANTAFDVDKPSQLDLIRIYFEKQSFSSI